MPFGLHSAAFWLVLVPFAALAALWLQWGVPGLMAGFLAGTAMSAAIMCVRFHALTQRPLPGAGGTATSPSPASDGDRAPVPLAARKGN